MPPLPVELNRDRRHEIRVAGRYETDGPFDVDLRNHGDGVHVHLNVAGDLAEVARVGESNPYVEADSSATARVDVDPVGETVAGELVLATGYGGEEVRVDVTVTPFEGSSEVPVGEDLAEPQGGGPPRAAVEADRDAGADLPVQVFAVAGGAVLLAVAAAVYVGGELVTVGAGLVVVAAVVAVGLALR